MYENFRKVLDQFQIDQASVSSTLAAKLGIDQLQIDRLSASSKLAEQLGIDRLSASSKLAEQLGIDRLSASSKLAEQLGIDRLSASSKLMAQIQAEQERFDARLRKEAATWQKLAQPSQDLAKQLGLTEIGVASLAWKSGLTQVVHRMQEINLLTSKLDLAARLLEPSKVYTEFVERTFQRIEQSKSTKVTKALQTSLHLAEEQLLTTTDSLSAILAVPEDDELVLPPRSLILPVVQQDELIAVVEAGDEEDEASLIKLSPSAKVADEARCILSLVAKCNEVVQVAGKAEIFKPTTRLLETFADLPWLIPEDKRSFADFVDCLYFIFYEGAGKDKLRFLDAHGGVLDASDCDFIWCIKHLRNKWLRHDADHGRESDIRKSWKDLSVKFNSLGLEYAPVTKQHFRHLHHSLLREANAFLRKILERLTNSL